VKPRTTLAIAFLLICLFIIQGVVFIRANSQTYDEAMHLAAGYSYLTRHDFRLEPQNPPLIKEYLALPVFLAYRLPFNPDSQRWNDDAEHLVGYDFLYKSSVHADEIIALSRLFNLFLGVGVIALVGWWASRLWGGGAAMLAMALASLDPNFVAHSSLVTTDVGVTLLIFLSAYLFWEYFLSPRWWLLIATGIAVGMALNAKFSGILLFAIMPLIVVLSLALDRNYFLLPSKKRGQAGYHLVQSATLLLLIFLLAMLAIPPVYFFQGFQAWLSGFYRFLTLAQAGQSAFFLGEYSYQGWWNYFLVAFLIKTPVGSLILIVASIVFWRWGSALRSRDAIFLLVPVLAVFLATTQAKVDIGLRHILPVYPFLFVLAGRLATIHVGPGPLMPLLLGVPLIFTAISSVRISPHHIAYFNELVGGPDQGYRYLVDSNLDWGQDLKGVKSYMEKERLPIIYLSYFGTAPPSYYGIRYQYVPGTWPLEWPPPAERVPADAPRKMLAISANNLQELATFNDPLFRWLRARQPITKIGYSIFVYDLTRDPEGLRDLAATYDKAGVSLSD